LEHFETEPLVFDELRDALLKVVAVVQMAGSFGPEACLRRSWVDGRRLDAGGETRNAAEVGEQGPNVGDGMRKGVGADSPKKRSFEVRELAL